MARLGRSQPQVKQVLLLPHITSSGPTTHQLTANGVSATVGAASVIETVVLTANGVATTVGTASLIETVVLTSNGVSATVGTATITMLHPLTANGVAATVGTASITAIEVLTANGASTTIGTATMVATLVLAASGTSASVGTASIGQVIPLAANGTSATVGSATITAINVLAASGTAATIGAASIIETVVLTANGVAATVGAASLIETVVLTANGASTTTGTATITATEVLTANGVSTAVGTATFTAVEVLTANGVAATVGTASITETVVLAAAGTSATTGTATLVSTEVLTANGAAVTVGSADLTIVGGSTTWQLAATGTSVTVGSASIIANLVLTANGAAVTVGQADDPAQYQILASGAATTVGTATLIVGPFRYWVGGDGTWTSSATTHWSLSSGGPSGASAPTSAQDVIIDANSGAGTISIDTATNASCRSFDSTNGACTMSWQNSATSVLKIGSASGGQVIIGTGMTITGLGSTSFNAIQLVATSSNGGVGWPITTNGKATPSINFNGVGGRWQFQDNWTWSLSGAGLFTSTAGTVDTNGKTLTGWAVVMSGGTILGTTATFNLAATSTAWTYGSGTFTSSGETINCTGAAGGMAGGGQTYKTVTFSGGGIKNLTGANTFTTLTVTGSASTDQFLLAADQTITGTFTPGGSTSFGIGRLFLASSVIGTTRTLNMTGGTLAFSGDVDFQDITVSGSPTVTGNASVWVGDCLGNTFGTVTRTTPVTSYWVGHTASWNNTTAWASSPGGTASTGRPPLPQDSIVFDGSSFSAGSQTTTMNYPRACASIDFSAATHSPTFANALTTTTYGSVTLVAGMAIGGGFTMTFQPRSVVTLTQAGVSTFFPTVMGGPTGTLRIVGALTIGNSGISVTAGTFDALTNNVAISAGSFSSGGTATRTISGGSTGWSLVQTGNLTIWNVASSGLTTNLSNTTISLTGVTASAQTFSHSGGTLGGINVTKNNAANNQTMIFLGGFTCNTWTLSNAGSGTSTFQWGQGQTFTTTSFSADKTGTNNLLIQSNGAGLQYTMNNSVAGTLQQVTGCTIQDSKVTGGLGWYAAGGSSLTSDDTGWTVGTWGILASGISTSGGAAVMAIVSALTANGVSATAGTASFISIDALTANGVATTVGTASMTATDQLIAAGTATTVGNASIVESATLVAAGTSTTVGAADITIAGGSTTWQVAATGTASTVGTATITDKDQLVAAGTAATVGTASITATQTLVAAGVATTVGTASNLEITFLTAAGIATSQGAAVLVAIAALSAAGSAQTSGTAVLAATLLLAASGASHTIGTAELRWIARAAQILMSVTNRTTLTVDATQRTIVATTASARTSLEATTEDRTDMAVTAALRTTMGVLVEPPN